MKINLPENALKYFNSKSRDFLLKLEPAPIRKKREKFKSSESHIPTKTLTDKQIFEVKFAGEINRFGKEVSKYFQTDESPIGLSGDNYIEFRKLVEELSLKKQFKEILSSAFIQETFFNWFENLYKGNIDQKVEFLDYLQNKSNDAVKKIKISIPLSNISIQNPFKLGNVYFEYFSKKFFNEMLNGSLKSNPGEKEQIIEGFERIRKSYQGTVFSSLILNAEQDKAIDIAVNETEKMLKILRFFSPSAVLPQIPSYLGRMGHILIPNDHFFIFENTIPIIQNSITEKRERTWKIRDKDIEFFHQIGIDNAVDLITKRKRNHFEDILLNSMNLFSKAIAPIEFHEKLVFNLVSLETLLLKDTSESIQTMLGLRLSFLIETDPIKRKDIINLIKKSYILRSSYIHHGELKEDIQLLEKLQHLVWDCLRNTLINKHLFLKKEDFFNYLESKILS